MVVWYMNGAGNDFAVVDARNISIDMSNMAKVLCEKGNCDGFMALDNSSIADIKLHFYNRDGSRADMCGNGMRCMCRFAYDNGIVGKEMTVETDAGIVVGERVSENIYRIKLNPPKNIRLDIEAGVSFVVVGVPHLVIELESLDFYDASRLFDRARALREKYDANVNFCSKISSDTVKVLTYERGVENFTLACGTGSGAVATILCKNGVINGSRVIVKNQGGDLILTNMECGELYLDGGAEVDGVVAVDLERLK